MPGAKRASIVCRPVHRLSSAAVIGAAPSFRSVVLGYEAPAAERRLVVIRALATALGQADLGPRQLLVGDLLEQVPDAVQPRPLLVVAPQDVPRRVLAVGGLEHLVPGPRV